MVPPIDREYTLQFFYDHKMLQGGERQTFAEVFPQVHRIPPSCKDEIQRRLGSGMNTSSTKVVDNAIVGYVRLEIKSAQTASN